MTTRDSIISRIYSLEVQGCMPCDESSFIQYTVLFNGENREDVEAELEEMVNDGFLWYRGYRLLDVTAKLRQSF